MTISGDRYRSNGKKWPFYGFLTEVLPKRTNMSILLILMKLSVKSDYAVRAVFGLSRHFASGKAVSVEKLAGEQTIPSNYLVQILLELKNQGIVTSVRGKEGGYMLARPPAEISLGDIIRSMHGSIFESPALQDTAVHPTIRSAWEKLQETLDETANTLTFKLMVDKADQQSEMYYI